MRAVLLIPLSVLVAAAPGCGHEGREEVAVVTADRDLTLPAQALELQTASPVELHQNQVKPTRTRPSAEPSRPARSARTKTSRVEAVAAPSQPASEAYVANDRELLPGETVTVIPAISGPTTAAEPLDELPVPSARRGLVGIRGGGKCPPRPARGIGIVGVPAARLY